MLFHVINGSAALIKKKKKLLKITETQCLEMHLKYLKGKVVISESSFK